MRNQDDHQALQNYFDLIIYNISSCTVSRLKWNKKEKSSIYVSTWISRINAAQRRIKYKTFCFISCKTYGASVYGLFSVTGDLGSGLVAWSFRRIFHRLVVLSLGLPSSKERTCWKTEHRWAAVKIRTETELKNEFEPDWKRNSEEVEKKVRHKFYLFITTSKYALAL